MTDHQIGDTTLDGDDAADGDTAEGSACRPLPGVDPAAVSAFVAALDAARTTLLEVPTRLEAARVHDDAFGKLIDAHKVRDAYHERLPATERNITEACEVIEHLTGEFAAVPAQHDDVASEAA
ncbi:MAG TPA: hypothetical protein VGZ32_07400 [Actinocrinis sp.]|uniref:hypothetical protein n=1 Tax=Actinocrinis sp. TaxID=1920516 RepID=UPI002DDD7D7F|nr:hypothetical protein [Actinocrinis sp.]HEV3170148.1 hypothetical protein [Actinocrinis sp.]